MLAHLSLKFRTDSEGLQQKEILDSLPKATRSSISHFLFYPLMDSVYLFRGVSNDLLFQLVIHSRSGTITCYVFISLFQVFEFVFFLCVKVSEMKAEYFPPKEDVILQNEAPTDFYILVSGALVIMELSPFILSDLIFGLSLLLVEYSVRLLY